ncbi:MAG: GNAT family N-acetyltransferase [Anaerolineae bacterium]
MTPEYRLTRVIRRHPRHGHRDRQPPDQFPPDCRGRAGEARRAQPRHPRPRSPLPQRDARRPASGRAALQSSSGEEIFLQFITAEREIAGFLRLSLPSAAPITDELAGAAVIREVHVYGQAVEIGEATDGRAQHAGLGTRLIERAADIARERGYARLAVISAVGTREYYRKRGFADGELYQVQELD